MIVIIYSILKVYILRGIFITDKSSKILGKDTDKRYKRQIQRYRYRIPALRIFFYDTKLKYTNSS